MPELYKAFSKALLHGNGYVFKELADRGYGRLKERIELDRGPFAELTDEQLRQQIADLERNLGVPHSEAEILLPASDDSNDDQKSKSSDTTLKPN